MASSKEHLVWAAGCVVWRRSESDSSGVEVLVVHRPRYDDWSFPKGKRDDGEMLAVTAVREVLEESAVRVRLGVPLGSVSYAVARGTKVVQYWAAKATKETPFTPNSEVDELRWLGLDEAGTLLSYDYDLHVLQAFREVHATQAHKTRTVIIQRHAEARSRNGWNDDDRLRPLSKDGQGRAAKLPALYAAYGIKTVVSSPAVRCIDTVKPFDKPTHDERLSEEAEASDVAKAVSELLDTKKPVVACSHRPTMPAIFAALGLETPPLKPGEALIVHHRKGVVLATEHVP